MIIDSGITRKIEREGAKEKGTQNADIPVRQIKNLDLIFGNPIISFNFNVNNTTIKTVEIITAVAAPSIPK